MRPKQYSRCAVKDQSDGDNVEIVRDTTVPDHNDEPRRSHLIIKALSAGAGYLLCRYLRCDEKRRQKLTLIVSYLEPGLAAGQGIASSWRLWNMAACGEASS